MGCSKVLTTRDRPPVFSFSDMKTMTQLGLTALLGVFICAFAGSRAYADGFVRPEVWYAKYTDGDFSARGAAGVMVGTAVGTEKNHELALEIARVPWNYYQQRGFAGLGITSSGHSVPALMNYRYYLGAPASTWRFYVGGAGGLSKLSGYIRDSRSGNMYEGKISKTKATIGATAGVSYNPSSGWSLDVGYRFLHADGTSVSSQTFLGAGGFTGPAGLALSLPKLDAHVLAVSATFRF